MCNLYKVEGGFRYYRSKYQTYPFGDLKVGEYFTIPLDKRNEVRSCAQYYGRKHGKKFAVITFAEDGNARCGRIA